SQDGGQQGARAAADVDDHAVTGKVVRVGDLGDGLPVEAGRRRAEQAGLVGMTKQSMHELVTHLERNSYLTREADPGDTRARLVRLTPSGHALEQDVHLAIAEVLESWRDRLGLERFDMLWSILQEITSETG